METTTIGGVPAQPVDLDSAAKVYHLPRWKDMTDPARLVALRQIALEAGRDPRLATLAVQIIRKAGVKPRDYTGQARALLKWTQHTIYYVNEPGERLQDPLYTLRVGYGDCDDMAILLAALCESIRLPWRFVISGKRGNQIVRWMEGTPYQPAAWAHIYLAVGNKPFRPTRWIYAEPTLRSVDLGWDVVSASNGGRTPLPELAGVGEDAAVKASDLWEDFTVQNVVQDVKKNLTPRKIVVGIILSAISGLIVRQIVRVGTKRRR